jgi:hypothetical protein
MLQLATNSKERLGNLAISTKASAVQVYIRQNNCQNILITNAPNLTLTIANH